MRKSLLNIRFVVLCVLILSAALSRLIPHPPNVAPISAMALLGAAYFSQRVIALLIPIAAMWISDLILNNLVYSAYFTNFVWFHEGSVWIYASFILIGFIGFGLLKKVHMKNVVLASILASGVFFVISNFGVWASGTLYPKNLSGLLSCYTAGLPFLRNTALGDLCYSGILFGLFEWSKQKFPILKKEILTHKKIQ